MKNNNKTRIELIMKSMKAIRFYLLMLSLLLFQGLSAQEYLTYPDHNPVLQKAFLSFKNIDYKTRFLVDTLPFVDDFSQQSVYPDPAKWEDNTVFINVSFPVNPPTIGVATFDGLRADGMPYSAGNNSHGRADSLTSHPLKLGNLSLADSVYLSFFYEAKGLGNAPENSDSLILRFKNQTGNWETVWKKIIQQASTDTFRYVMIGLKKTDYFYNGFQFQFINYATLTGNNDHWHIDYVKMDKNRSINNRQLNDVAFNRMPPGLLMRYESMPLNQFKGFETQELVPNLQIFASNHFNVIKNTTFSYEASERCTHSVLNSTFIETINFPANSDTSLTDPVFLSALQSYLSTNTCDSLSIQTKYYLNNSPPDFTTRFNDTVYQLQHFFNYFAYDDGSAEQAYGLIGTGAYMAYEFESNVSDTLQAVAIHFAHINGDISNYLFSIVIWDQLDIPSGANDHILYRQDFMTPAYIDSLNGFATYILDTPQVVNGKFFIGWQQSQSGNMSVGFDKNHDAGVHMYYNVTGTWSPTAFHGALMMRPLLGKKIKFPVGIPKATPVEISLWPNPAKDILYLKSTIPDDAFLGIYDLSGKLLPVSEEYISSSGRQFDISHLASGIYLLRMQSSGRLFIKE